MSSTLVSLTVCFLRRAIASARVSQRPGCSVPDYSTGIPLGSVSAKAIVFLIISKLELVSITARARATTGVRVVVGCLSLCVDFLDRGFLFLFSTVVFSSSLRNI